MAIRKEITQRMNKICTVSPPLVDAEKIFAYDDASANPKLLSQI